MLKHEKPLAKTKALDATILSKFRLNEYRREGNIVFMEPLPHNAFECEKDIDRLMDTIDLLREHGGSQDVISIFVQDQKRPEVAQTHKLDLNRVQDLLLRIRQHIKTLPDQSSDGRGALHEDAASLCAEIRQLLFKLQIRGFKGKFNIRNKCRSLADVL